MAANTGVHIEDFKVEGYRLLEKISEGSSAVVFRAQNTSDLTQYVAIKISKTEWTTESSVERIRFENEAQLLSQLSHPGIVKVHKIGSSNGHSYVAMEYFQGLPLDRQTSLRLDQKVEIIRQVALGLSHSHSRRIIHRDIKPANILVSFDGDSVQVKIVC